MINLHSLANKLGISYSELESELLKSHYIVPVTTFRDGEFMMVTEKGKDAGLADSNDGVVAANLDMLLFKNIFAKK